MGGIYEKNGSNSCFFHPKSKNVLLLTTLPFKPSQILYVDFLPFLLSEKIKKTYVKVCEQIFSDTVIRQEKSGKQGFTAGQYRVPYRGGARGVI